MPLFELLEQGLCWQRGELYKEQGRDKAKGLWLGSTGRGSQHRLCLFHLPSQAGTSTEKQALPTHSSSICPQIQQLDSTGIGSEPYFRMEKYVHEADSLCT